MIRYGTPQPASLDGANTLAPAVGAMLSMSPCQSDAILH